MNYEILVNNKVWKRHVDQILRSTELTNSDTTEKIEEDTSFEFPFTNDKPDSLPETSTSRTRYPSRDRRPPDRLSYH